MMNSVCKDPVHERIREMVRWHMVACVSKKPELKEKIRTGNYSYNSVDDKYDFVGSLMRDHSGIYTRGSVRYGDCMAVPDDRGVIHMVFLGYRSAHFEHSIAGVIMPEDFEYDGNDLLHAELKRMWNYRHVSMSDLDLYVPASLVKSDGPGIDIDKEEAKEIVGRVNRWFEAQLQTSNRVCIGDYMETRLKKGADRGLRARFEATESGFVAYIGERNSDEETEDNDVNEWRMLWQSSSLQECLEFAVSDTDTRREYVRALVESARERGGFLRYINGSLFGAMHSGDSVYLIKNWMVYELRSGVEGSVFHPALETTDVLSLCG